MLSNMKESGMKLCDGWGEEGGKGEGSKKVRRKEEGSYELLR